MTPASQRPDEDLLAARRWHEQSLRLARTLDDQYSIARLCCLLGGVLRLLGDYAARGNCSPTRRHCPTRRIPGRAGGGWIFPADLAVNEGHYERAAELYGIALRDFQRVGFRPGVNWVTQRLGILAIRMGDHHRDVRILSAPHEIDALALAGVFRSLSVTAAGRWNTRALNSARNPLQPSPQLARHSRWRRQYWRRCRR